MPPPHSRAYLRQIGSARDTHVRDSRNSRSESFFSEEHFIYYDEPPPHVQSTSLTGAWISDTSQILNSRPSRYATSLSESEFDCPPQYYHPGCSSPQKQEVPRPRRGALDLQYQQTPREGNSRNDTRASEYSTNHRRHTATRQPRPVANEHQDPHVSHYCANSRPLGKSNLSELNRNRSPIRIMDRRAYQDQRIDPYDAVGYVGRHSDYQRRDGYTQHHHEERYDEEYVDDFDEGLNDNEVLDFDEQSSVAFH